MLSPNIFTTIFVFPILNLLIILYHLFLILKLPGAFGFAVIGLTLVIRLLFHPFFKSQMETAQKMQRLKPHLDKLAKKHKKNPRKLQQEQLKLYQEFGVNPASGCLFMILQIPVFIALYQTLSLLLINKGKTKIIADINKVLYFSFLKISHIDPWFFGFNLALSPAQSKQPYYLIIPLITAGLQYLQQTKFSQLPQAPEKPTPPKNKSKKEEKKEENEFQKAMQTQMKFVFPLMLGWFSYSLPLGLSLYWNIFSLFSIIQYRKLTVRS